VAGSPGGCRPGDRMSKLIFGSPEAEAVLEQVRQMGLSVVPDDVAVTKIAGRIWEMVLDTYADNLYVNRKEKVVEQEHWHKEMVQGIVGILKGWRP
jgi:hypothetical protein